jgi:mono/diheme cytochrome c family protein
MIQLRVPVSGTPIEEIAMIKPLLFASSVVLFAIAASSAAGPVAQESAQAVAPAMKNPVKPTAQTKARAKEIYSVDCALCHGENGDGKTDVAKGMDLSLGDWTYSKTLAAKPDGELFNIIRNGKGKMPSEVEGRAKDHEVWSLILYIRSMASNAEPAAAPAPAAAAPAAPAAPAPATPAVPAPDTAAPAPAAPPATN